MAPLVHEDSVPLSSVQEGVGAACNTRWLKDAELISPFKGPIVLESLCLFPCGLKQDKSQEPLLSSAASLPRYYTGKSTSKRSGFFLFLKFSEKKEKENLR